MRRLIPLLILAIAAPAWAVEPDAEVPPPERKTRAERPMRAVVERMQRVERVERVEPSTERQLPVFERPRREERRQRQAVVPDQPAAAARDTAPILAPAPAPVAAERRNERLGDGLRERRWQERRGERRTARTGELPQPAPSPVIGEVLPGPRSLGSAPAVQGDRRIGNVLRNRIATEGWRREWRDDRRFDWRRHRDRDRSRFRVGIYYDPFGWGYRRWNLGWSMPSRFYSDRYWINDPFYYRLPPAYGPYRWVRYWDDALLVDLRTGRVVDVIHNFFW